MPFRLVHQQQAPPLQEAASSYSENYTTWGGFDRAKQYFLKHKREVAGSLNPRSYKLEGVLSGSYSFIFTYSAVLLYRLRRSRY